MLHKCIILLFLCPLLSVAQIDSLQSVLVSAKTDSLKANTHILLYQELLKRDTAAAFTQLEMAEKISKNLNSIYLLGSIMNQKGVFLENTYQIDSAISIYNEGIDLVKNTLHERLLLQIKMNLIWAYFTKDQQAKSIVLGYEMLKSYQKLEDSLMIAKSLKTIGVSYDYLSEHQTAIKLYNQALSYYLLLKNKDGEAGTRLNLAGIYIDEGEIEKAENEYLKVIEIVKLLDDPHFLAMAYNNYGLVYQNTDFKKAESLYLKAQKIAMENNDIFHLGFTNQNLSLLNYKFRNYHKALNYANITLEIANKIHNSQLILNSNYYLYDIYYALGDYKKAIKHKLLADAIEDSTYTKENAQIIHNLKAKYESDKKEAENELLRKDAELKSADIKKQNSFIVFILISLIGVILTGVIYFRASFIRKGLIEEVREKNKKVEEQAEKLKELDIAKSRFFANVSHDLRTPLTLIMGSLDRISESKESYLTHESTKDLISANKNSKRLLFLANEINDLNQLEEGRLRINLETINIDEFVKLIVGMFSSAADSKSIQLNFESSSQLDICINADPNHFERIIYNLLNNALKFTNSGGSISIKNDLITIDNSQYIQITISDTGKGISENSLPYIFDRFYQSLLNEYSAREGFGIGLALVKELVSLHNGEIKVESEIGVGSSFMVTCPIVIDAGKVAKPSISLDYDKDWLVPNKEVKTGLKIDIPENQPTSNKRVLIVEDHPEVREYINDIISKEYQTQLASDGGQALKILEGENIDLVVTDLMMPWMDGFELIEKMKSESRYKNIPIMVVSARTNDKDRTKILEMGVNNYLIKPFKSKELLARIENMINAKGVETNNLFVNNEGNLEGIEKNLLKKVESLIIENISNSKLSVLHLADEMAASERQVYRMIKKLAGITPYEYIKEVRWQYVEYLLKNNKVQSISEAAKNIGMTNVTDFKRQFRKRFEREPSEYIV